MMGNLSFLRPFIQIALEKGIPSHTLAVLLILPLGATLIAIARHFVGLRGLGIFTPLMLAIIFLTGEIKEMVLSFFLILGFGAAARFLIRRFKIHYLARMAILLWIISLLALVNIFWLPLLVPSFLFLLLLTFYIIESQTGKPIKEAFRLTTETFFLALGVYFIFSWGWLQRVVLVYPEPFLIGTVVLDFLIGRFTGLRLLEYHRFKKLI